VGWAIRRALLMMCCGCLILIQAPGFYLAFPAPPFLGSFWLCCAPMRDNVFRLNTHRAQRHTSFASRLPLLQRLASSIWSIIKPGIQAGVIDYLGSTNSCSCPSRRILHGQACHFDLVLHLELDAFGISTIRIIGSTQSLQICGASRRVSGR
jgi:hypothetical protein